MSRAPSSRDVSRRNFVIGGALLGTAGLAASFAPQQSVKRVSDRFFDALFPLQIGAWRYLSASGLVLPPSDQLSRTLYEHLLTRVYEAPDGAQVMLLLAYSSVQEGRLQVHRPEVCYPAAGFAIVENVEHLIAVTPQFFLPTRFLLAQQNTRREYLVYWTRVGSALPTRWFDQRLTMARENLEGRIPDGMLARVSTLAPDSISAGTILDGFTRDLITSLSPPARRILVGPH